MALRSLTVTLSTPFTARLKCPSIVYTLDLLGLPKQYDTAGRCWMTARRSVGVLIAYAEREGWRVQVLDSAQATLEGLVI